MRTEASLTCFSSLLFRVPNNLVDNSDRSVIVTITAFGEDGQPFGPQDLQQNPVAQAPEPGEVHQPAIPKSKRGLIPATTKEKAAFAA